MQGQSTPVSLNTSTEWKSLISCLCSFSWSLELADKSWANHVQFITNLKSTVVPLLFWSWTISKHFPGITAHYPIIFFPISCYFTFFLCLKPNGNHSFYFCLSALTAKKEYFLCSYFLLQNLLMKVSITPVGFFSICFTANRVSGKSLYPLHASLNLADCPNVTEKYHHSFFRGGKIP